MRTSLKTFAGVGMLACLMLAQPVSADQLSNQMNQLLNGVDCTFGDGFTPPIGYSGSQGDLVMAKIPVGASRQSADLDSVIKTLEDGLASGKDSVNGDAGQESIAQWLAILNEYSTAMHTYNEAIQILVKKYNAESDAAAKEVYAQKVCDVAVAEAGIVDRVAGYLNLQIAAVWNGTSTALPSSGNLPAATANATTATAVKAESEALNAAPAGTSGTSGTPKTLNDQILSGSVLTLPLPLGDITLPNLIARVITQVLSIVGALALLFFVWGGVTWMLASGDAKKIEDAKKIIIAAVSGLAAIFLSYAILNFILNAISSKV